MKSNKENLMVGLIYAAATIGVIALFFFAAILLTQLTIYEGYAAVAMFLVATIFIACGVLAIICFTKCNVVRKHKKENKSAAGHYKIISTL